MIVLHDHLFTSCIVVRGSRPGKQVQLSEDEIKFLCSRAREIFMSQPILLDLEAPIKICGKCNTWDGCYHLQSYVLLLSR